MTLSFVAQLPWMQALGWTLLHFIWQGALVGVVFLALRALIPAHHSNARYANGLAALALMLIFPLVTLFAMLRPEAQIESVSATVVTSAIAAVEAAHPAGMSVMDGVLQWIVCVWLAGVLLMAYRSWYQWRSLMQVAHKWAQSDPTLEAAMRTLVDRFGFVRRIKVLVSDRIDTPILIGWFKPIILLPTAVVLGFPRQQIELILAHEIGHLRRYDHLVNLAQALVETLLFYHPVVHWISREVRNEREICCDTLVLSKTSGDPCEYARTLAALEELRQPAAQLAIAANGGELLERVRRILSGQRHMKRSARWPWLFAVAGAAVAFLVALRVERLEPVQVAGPDLLSDSVSVARIVPEAAFAIAPLRLQVLASRREVEPLAIRPAEPAETAPLQVASARAALPEKSEVALVVTDAVPESPSRPAMVKSEVLPAVAEAAPEPPAIAPSPQAEARPASLATADVTAEQTPPSPRVVDRKAPVATHTVSPEYPDATVSNQTERVKLEFAIGPDGGVRDIRVVSEQPAAFARAAERALKQWQFARGSFAPSAKKRYAQTFVFASPRGDGEMTDAGCERRTGTRLCRRPGDSAIDALNSSKEVAQMRETSGAVSGG